MGTKQLNNVYDALVIGAGFSGLYQLHRLRDDLGLKVAVIEKGAGVGGTWYWNRYPGARCDSESQGYAYFFSRELHENWQWSERYPGHAEIRKYLNYVADSLNLRKDIFFNKTVTKCSFSKGTELWEIQTEDSGTLHCKWLVTAVGCLSAANVPNITGASRFEGQWYHTGAWPHNDVDFNGLCVGQIGTGSTGIQAAPEIAKTCNHLTVFQRTPNYSIPARNTEWDASYTDWVRSHYDELKTLVRSTPNGHPFRISNNLTMEVPDEERQKVFEAAWSKGGLRFRGVFHDLLTSQTANSAAADFIKSKIRQKVTDPKTAYILTNIDHPFAAKRPPIDTHYFETFNKDHVTLVDLQADPIAEITHNGIVLESGMHHELDVIVFATGYDAMTGPLLNLNIETPKASLKSYWEEGPSNYLGLAIPGFPNLFTITGPGSPSVLSNMPVSIEQHVDWITECIAHCIETGCTSIEAQEQSAEIWTNHVRETADATLLPKVQHSWYLGANIPGKPRVFMPYAGGLNMYRKICNNVAEEGYKGFDLNSGKALNSSKPFDFIPSEGFLLGV